MALTRTQILTIARQFVSDNDTTNPFWSDINAGLLLDNGQADLASYLRWPRATGTPASLVASQDDYSLPTDWLSTIDVIIYDSSGYKAKLKYKTEEEISRLDPNWRNNTSYGTPRYYFIAGDVAASTTLSRKLFVYPPPATADTSKYILQIYVQVPATISASNIPVFPGPMHMILVYYLAWQMSIPLDMTKAEEYRKVYETERRRMCGEGRRESEKSDIIQFK
jgi:hypothetical protein